MKYMHGIWCIPWVYLWGRHIHVIYYVYTMYIPWIYYVYIIHIHTLPRSLVYTLYILYIYHILVWSFDIAWTSSLQGFVALIDTRHRPISAWRTTGQMFMMKQILISPIHKQCCKDSCPICPSWRMMSTRHYLICSTVFQILQVIPLPKPFSDCWIKMERHVTGARTGYVFHGKYYVYTSYMHDIYCVYTMYIKEF